MGKRTLFAAAASLAVATSAQAVGVTGLDPAAERVAEQGQFFYSPEVSRIAVDGRGACMVSTGTDWPNTATAQRVAEPAQPVALKDLASNTPFVEFIGDEAAMRRMRIAMGFSIAPGSFGLIGPDGQPIELTETEAAIEDRGDSVLVSGPRVEALFAAWTEGEGFHATARSDKTVAAREHVITYEFVGGYETAALETCRKDLAAEVPIRTAPTPAVTLAATTAEPDRLDSVRGMACNRDLDLTQGEVVALSGEVTGLATPLGYAVVLRGGDGKIEHVVSGDLWRIDRTRDGFEMQVSNSIMSQSPLDNQSIKSCTRYAAPRCATVYEAENGGIEVAECVGVFLAESVNLDGPDWVQGPIGPLPSLAAPAASDPGILLAAGPAAVAFPPVWFNGGGGGGSSGSSSPDPSTGGGTTKPGPKDPGDKDPAVIPLPMTALLLATAVAGLGYVRPARRRTLDLPHAAE